MNRKHTMPSNMKQLRELSKWVLSLENIPEDAKVYLNAHGNIQINWETEQERKEAIKTLNSMNLELNKKRYEILKKEIKELEEKLSEAIRED